MCCPAFIHSLNLGRGSTAKCLPIVRTHLIWNLMKSRQPVTSHRPHLFRNKPGLTRHPTRSTAVSFTRNF